MYIDQVKTRLMRLGFVLPNEIVPCTAKEVQELEQEVGLTLPIAYKEFLLWIGHGAGKFLRGSDCFYEHLIDIQEWAVELLRERNSVDVLPNDAFIFWMHQGYQFSFFRTSEGENPPVHHFHETYNDDRIIWEKQASFTRFMEIEVEDHGEHNRRIAQIEIEMARDWRNA